MELSFAVVLILQSVALVFQTGNGGGAYAYHVHPPNSFYPPPGFHGRGRGRRYDGGDNEDDYNDGNNNNNNNNNDHHHRRRRQDGWFYAPHPFPHPDDPYFHHYHDDLPPPPPPFPPPPPYYRHPRFMEPPHVAMYDTTPELSQSQLLTTRRNNRNKKNDDDDDDSHFSMEYNTQTKTETTTVSTPPPVQSIWKTSAPVLVPSSTLQTFAFDTPTVERVQVLLKTGHRHGRSRSIPLQARIDVWHGPDSTPQNLAIYLEDDEEDDDEGDDDDLVFADEARRSIHGDDDDDDEEEEDTTNFSAIIETPQGYNTIAVRNTAPNFDLLACVEGEECPTDIATNNNGIPHRHMNGDPSGYYYEQTYGIPRSEAQRKNQFQHSSTRHARQQEHTSTTTNSSPLQSVIERLMATSTPQLIEGTRSTATVSAMDIPVRPDIHTVRLAQNVASVQVLLRTDYMRPLQARVELILKERSSTNHKDPGRVLKRTIVEVFSEDGMHRPFFAVLETPKPRKRKRPRPEDEEKRYTISLRVINLSGAEFPIFASVEPYIIDTNHEKVSAEGAKNKGDNINNDNGRGSFDGRNGDGMEPENVWNSAGYTQDDEQHDDNDISEEDWWEQSMENSHFGGGSHYDLSTNSTILDAEIL
ncbi:hypothetical protein IV203_016391 [Nitzschia inconspicua]|uniref:Uncharacterized protein n=1 Tax=Nitzschia inconspicua TaxID=303405 RepID=A0A9K3KQI4_9STRA|nr:hypothetical protein IV203_016391 [Nitzschia inconspicua]